MSRNNRPFMLIMILLLLSGCGTRVIDGQQVDKKDKIIIKFSHVVEENTPKGLAAIRFAFPILNYSKMVKNLRP